MESVNVLDKEGKELYSGDTVEIDEGIFINKHYEKTLHRVEWYPPYQSYCFIGINCFTEKGTPTINEINYRWSKYIRKVENYYEENKGEGNERKG